jgi:hypothetical protein
MLFFWCEWRDSIPCGRCIRFNLRKVERKRVAFLPTAPYSDSPLFEDALLKFLARQGVPSF